MSNSSHLILLENIISKPGANRDPQRHTHSHTHTEMRTNSLSYTHRLIIQARINNQKNNREPTSRKQTYVTHLQHTATMVWEKNGKSLIQGILELSSNSLPFFSQTSELKIMTRSSVLFWDHRLMFLSHKGGLLCLYRDNSVNANLSSY